MNHCIKASILMLASLWIAGCASVADSQNRAMDHYRAELEKERQMPKEAQDQYYETALWYNPTLWQSENATKMANHQGAKKAQEAIEQDFYSCVQAADEVEKGISAQIGGIDPIQITHARASVEVCMVAKKYRGKDRSQKLICESSDSDVLPICSLARDEVLNYRGWG
ncbi:hypothetical protein [Ignatzschineria sp. LJL83]